MLALARNKYARFQNCHRHKQSGVCVCVRERERKQKHETPNKRLENINRKAKKESEKRRGEFRKDSISQINKREALK